MLNILNDSAYLLDVKEIIEQSIKKMNFLDIVGFNDLLKPTDSINIITRKVNKIEITKEPVIVNTYKLFYEYDDVEENIDELTTNINKEYEKNIFNEVLLQKQETNNLIITPKNYKTINIDKNNICDEINRNLENINNSWIVVSPDVYDIIKNDINKNIKIFCSEFISTNQVISGYKNSDNDSSIILCPYQLVYPTEKTNNKISFIMRYALYFNNVILFNLQ